jgi:hypothetical protein
LAIVLSVLFLLAIVLSVLFLLAIVLSVLFLLAIVLSVRDIDLIFGMWVYSDKLQIEFTFLSGPMILGRGMALGL